ncbi:hypothetical protein [Sphingomonas turrisvirgatae]|uniref:Uncharacterized protein n=1 Tax=Sphingomonas turrisvirgatae TaxID=1888892 RepID=A0A1E3LQT9_9SPHN|nr:hypothetical protein [Sphingomonas turrisvirgatae]ODP36118.1 hypothetical protein BFL28_06815 [Sphingomonas turrisvirgatae]
MPLRLASVWLALVVALLSSLMSEGLPRTTAVGSAFNPATTAVALQPSRVQPRVRTEQVRRNDIPAGGQSAPIASLHPIALPVAPPAPVDQPPKGDTAMPAGAQPRGLDGSPRGPPLP